MEIKSFLSDEPEDTPIGESLEKAVNDPQSVFIHLNALRKHLFRAFLVMGIVTILAFAFASQIIDLLAYPVGGIEALVAIDPTEPIGTFMRVHPSLLRNSAAMCGVIVVCASPCGVAKTD